MKGDRKRRGAGPQPDVPDHASASSGAPPDPHAPLVGPSLLLWLSELRIKIAPGQTTRLRINIRNISAVVQTFTLTPIGPAAAWCVILPSQISLFPGDEGSASLVIRPPKATTLAAGDYILGVKATSEVHTTDQVVGEVDIAVEPYHQFKASLSRGTIDLRRSTTAFIQISNDGNSSVDFDVLATDPDGRLRIKLAKEQVILAPGEPTWVKLQVKAPWHIIGSPITYGLVATVGAHRDLVTNEILTSVKPSVQRATLIQRPLIHLRLGFFGRILILLTILGLLAAFLVPRLINAFVPRLVTGSPIVPAGFTAELDASNQVVLSWQPSSGATGYSIYAIGAAGNPSPSPSPSTATATVTATATATVTTTATVGSTPTLTSPTGGATPAASTPAPATPAGTTPAATRAAARLAVPGMSVIAVSRMRKRGPTAAQRDSTFRARERERRGTASPTVVEGSASASTGAVDRAQPAIGNPPAPTPTPTPTLSMTLPSDSASPASSVELATLPVPLCDGCTHITDVAAGSTRFVITNAPPGITACYRVVATAGTAMSLYSPQACVTTPAATGNGAGGTAAGSSSAGAGASGSPTSTAGGGSSGASSGAAALPPCAPGSVQASAVTANSVTVQWVVASAPVSTPASPSAGAGSGKEPTCSPTTAASGFRVQRKVAKGDWTDTGGVLAATSASLVITGLPASTRTCVRVQATSSVGSSAFSSSVCVRTASATASAEPSGSSSPTASPSATASSTSSATSTPTSSPTSTASARSASGIRLPRSASAAAVTTVTGFQRAVSKAQAAAAGTQRTAALARNRATALQSAHRLAASRAADAQRRLDSWAAAMYRQGDVPSVLAALMGEADVSGRANAYLREVTSSAQQVADSADAAQREAQMLSEQAETASRSAEVLATLAQQRLGSLRSLLQDAERELRAALPSRTQVVVGVDGCPTSAPEGTLRAGSLAVGVTSLCQASVAQAATPQAALAILFALGHLGAPYACGGVGRLEASTFDCSSFVARAFAEGAGITVARADWAPSTRNMVPWDGIALDRHYALVAPDEIAPGDLVLYDTGGRTYRHVVMVLADGWMVHTNACGDVAHVERFWGTGSQPGRQFLVARRVLLDSEYQVQPSDPALAPPLPPDGTDQAGVGDPPATVSS